MTLLLPLGLIGLAAIIALLVIYFIKPNYQQKYISSTYVWKLSLQYKKKRLPINKLRNLLLIICQVLILVACALILSQPAQVLKTQQDKPEVIAIIDSSASMRAQIDGETRYERAVKEVKDLVNGVFNSDGMASVILAEEKPQYLAQRTGASGRNALTNSLNNLLEDNLSCTYGEVNIDDAMMMCERILSDNPDAEVYVYTDCDYYSVPDSVKLVNVSEEEEWNASILGAKAVFEDNWYYYEVDVACYGRNEEISVSVEIYGANADDSSSEGTTETLNAKVLCNDDQPVKVIFIDEDKINKTDEAVDRVYVPIPKGNNGDDDKRVFAYQSIHFQLDDIDDSYNGDNTFEIYNGQKEVIKVQYSTYYSVPTTNPFFKGALLTLQNMLKDKWDIEITEVKNEEAATEGFDFYIFEHIMPERLPQDGVVFLSDCRTSPAGLRITFGGAIPYRDNMPLAREEESDILNYFDASSVYLRELTRVVSYDSSYNVLLTCDSNPVLMVKDDEDAKIIVAPFSLHMSNLPVRKEMFTLMYNLFEHFIPSTVEGNAFEVNESIVLHSRGNAIEVNGKDKYEVFPATLQLSLPGTYTLTQTTFFGKDVVENIYVRMPASESNIKVKKDVLPNPYPYLTNNDFYRDLAVYVAAALVALLFIEWLLQSREM